MSNLPESIRVVYKDWRLVSAEVILAEVEVALPELMIVYAPVIWNGPGSPLGHERGIHILCKWKPVNGEFPHPHMLHTHGTPL